MSDVQTKLHDDGEGGLVVERIQDVEPVLEQAKALRNAGAGRGDDLQHAASFPRVVVEHYCNQHGITLQEWIVNPVHAQRMLDDRDLAGFRVMHKVIV